MRTCDFNGCDRKHLAKGYCGSHYNLLVLDQSKRHPRSVRPCEVCGAEVVRAIDPRRRTTCSVVCRTALTWGSVSAGGYDWAQCAMSRAKRMGATIVERIEREDVFARDSWICYLCDTDTSLATSAFDPSAPTVDHVVSPTKGGQHTMSNVRCCCLSCNSSKQASSVLVSHI